MTKVRKSQCGDVTESDPESDSDNLDHLTGDNIAPRKLRVVSALRRVSTNKSPYFKAFHKNFPLQLTLDTGAEVSMIRASSAVNRCHI